MSHNNLLIQQFLKTVDNQLRDNDPPETRQTLDRLQQEGYAERDAKLLIAQCVAAEMMAVMQSNEPFNEVRYVKWLHQLPKSPE